MKKFFPLLSCFFLFSSTESFPNITNYPNLTDNSTQSCYPYSTIYTAGQLTCNANGTATISITGGGGGTSSLQVTQSGIQITSPTASINFYNGDFGLQAIGTTSQIILNPSTTDFIHNQTFLQSGATFYVSSGSVSGQLNANYMVAYGSMTVGTPNSGNGNMQLTLSGSTYTVTASSDVANVTAGHLAKWSSNSYTLVDGGLSAGVTPAGNAYDVQVASPSLNNLAGYDNFQNNGQAIGMYGVGQVLQLNLSSEVASGVLFNYASSTMTISSSTITNLNLSTLQGVTPGLIAGTNISSIIGTWPNQTINASLVPGGNAYDVQVASPNKTQFAGYDNFQNSGQAIGMYGVGQVLQVNLSSEVATGVLFNYNTSTMTISSMSVLGQFTAGTIQGASLSTCGDGTHALNWTGGSFGCQTLTSGGGGGASTLAIAIGSSSTWKTQITSPTAAVNFDQSQFKNSLANGSTAFITISYSTNAQTGNYTMWASTDSIVVANCASACTVTLPSASLVAGRPLWVKIIGTGTTSITSISGTIDGSSTITPNPNQYADIEVISDGTNWEIL